MSNFTKTCTCGKDHMARSPRLAQHAQISKDVKAEWATKKIAEIQAGAEYDAGEKAYYSDIDTVLGTLGYKNPELDGLVQKAIAAAEKK